MNNIIQFPVVAGIEITTDEEGRFSLNALHKASGNENGKRPSLWLATKQAKELVSELSKNSCLGCSVINSVKGGVAPGTFAVEQLAVAYANWISSRFYLLVINTFIDHKKGVLQPAIPQSYAEALRLGAELVEKSEAQQKQIQQLTPKAEALNRIAEADGSLCITDAAKDLQVRPKDLRDWLSQNRWIYKRSGSDKWTAYQARIEQGVLEHKTDVIPRKDGSEKIVEQARVTAKGLTRLAELGAGQRQSA